jgi:hypothetical protein
MTLLCWLVPRRRPADEVRRPGSPLGRAVTDRVTS